GFLLIGWLLMPEHFHLLIKPVPAEATSRFMQELKKRTAQRIVSARGDGPEHPWWCRMLTGFRLPPTANRRATLCASRRWAVIVDRACHLQEIAVGGTGVI
ncbi:MAG: transposase, partial [Terriglobia bacterium]